MNIDLGNPDLLNALRDRLLEGKADGIAPMAPTDVGIINLVDQKLADKSSPPSPPASEVKDIMEKIRDRGPPQGQQLPKDWSVVQVQGHPSSFFIRTWSENGKVALVYLLTNTQDISVQTREGSSNLTITFNDLSQATYFKLKYCH